MFIFGDLVRLLPRFQNVPIIDNFIFRLHYWFTLTVLIAFVLLLTGKGYLGDPIHCNTIDNSVPSDVLDQFCWIQSTYSLPEFWHLKVGKDVPYDGIGKNELDKPKVYHKYYQWVVFMLFLQATMFYFPRFLWLMWEGGKVNDLLMDLGHVINAKEACRCEIACETKEFGCEIVCKQKEKYHLLCKYFQTRTRKHWRYAFRYVFCEFLNLINVIGQIYLTDRFLGHSFLSYGTDVFKYMNSDHPSYQTSPMVMVFPRMAMCTFYRFGYGAGLEAKEAICILPLNIVNEKIYLFLWIWFVALATITVCNIICLLLTLFVPLIREFLLKSESRYLSSDTVKQATSQFDFGDWLVLYLLSKNMEAVKYEELIHHLASHGKAMV